jgi:hypothetical protein
VPRITVKLMREPAEPVESTTDIGGFIAFCSARREWRVLHAIDDVGDTEVFGPWIGDLLADWDEARGLVRSFADESCWHKVRELAVECQSDPGLYLQFVGD